MIKQGTVDHKVLLAAANARGIFGSSFGDDVVGAPANAAGPIGNVTMSAGGESVDVYSNVASRRPTKMRAASYSGSANRG